MIDKPIPKSLHTVRVVVLMAHMELAYAKDAARSSITPSEAVARVMRTLGYADTLDTHDIRGAALRAFQKGA